jgi:hypothetical protein
MSVCDSIPAPSTPTRPTKKLRPDAPVRVLSESVVAVDDQHTARRLFYFEPEFTTPDRRPRAQVPNAPPRGFHTNSDNFNGTFTVRPLVLGDDILEPTLTTPDRRPRAQVPNAPPRVFHTNSDNFYVCYASRMLSF